MQAKFFCLLSVNAVIFCSMLISKTITGAAPGGSPIVNIYYNYYKMTGDGNKDEDNISNNDSSSAIYGGGVGSALELSLPIKPMDSNNNNNKKREQVVSKRPVLTKPRMQSAEHRLYKYLFRPGGYRRTVRPKINHNERLFVSLGICIMSVDEILENQDPMVTSGCVKLKWTDEYLTWDPVKFGNLTTLVLPSSDIWLPDIALINSAEPYITNRTSFVEVSYKGSVGFYPSGRFSTKCKISLTFFPFDRQVCEMQFESWTYPIEWIELILWPMEPIDVKDFYRNHQWDLDRVDAVSGKAFYDGFEFSTMRFVFHVRRRTLHYITLYIFPCGLISIMQVLSHSLPVEHPARITLLTGIFVAQSVIQSSLTSQTPKSSDGISLTQLYIEIFTACMLFSMIVTFINMHVWFRVSTSPLLSTCRYPSLGILIKSFFFWDIKASSTHYHFNYQHQQSHQEPAVFEEPPAIISSQQAAPASRRSSAKISPKSRQQMSESLRKFCRDLRRQQQQQQQQSFEMTPMRQTSYSSSIIVHDNGSGSHQKTTTVKRGVQFRPPSSHRYSTLSSSSNFVGAANSSSLALLNKQGSAPLGSPTSGASCTSTSSLVLQKEAWLRFCLTLDKICMYVFLISNVLSPLIIFAIVPRTYNEFLRVFDEDAHNATNYFYTIDDIKVHYFHDLGAR